MSEDRLNELRQRWEADPQSRVFLQLAEEHRRLGEAREAIGVLEQGLERSPNHLSAQVALGRCHLELGENETAATILGRVLDRDPTQLVANKLLIEAHLGLGELRQAELQLDRYSQLNSSDPIIEEMRERLAAAREEAAPPPARESSKKSASLLEDVTILEASPMKASSAALAYSRSSTREDPFPELTANADDGRLHLEGLGLEGLFPSAAAPPHAPALAKEQIPDDDDLFGLAKPEPATTIADDDDIFGLRPKPAPVPDELVPPPPAHARVETSFDRLDVKIHAASLPAPSSSEERTEKSVETNFDRLEARIHHPGLVAPPDPVVFPDLVAPLAPAELVAPSVAHARMETNFDRLLAKIHHEAAPVSLAEPPAPETFIPTSTVTLANLYRQQGHEEKAQEVFRAVLERDPNNAEARAALGEDEAPTPWRRLTAGQLLVGADSSLGPWDRKVLLLGNYLRRLRREA